MSTILQARLSVDYASKPGVLQGLEFDIASGEILGLVGESGSGKSTVALSILGLLAHKHGSARGEILYRGRDLLGLRGEELRRIRGREIALVLQSPLASLNPALRIGAQLAEAWRAHSGDPSGWREHALESFRMVSLPDGASLLDRYPRQLSVGQAQRVLIAMAVLHRPALLIADEPTSALDAITQAEILQLFRRLSRELNMAILFISHDLLSVANLCDRLAILREGRIVECGATEQLFSNPRNSYTRALLEAMPRLPITSGGLEMLARQLAPEPAEEKVSIR
jgi:ABC-type glutathione transport system ATPase component